MIKILSLIFLVMGLTSCSSLNLDCGDMSKEECRAVTLSKNDTGSFKFKVKSHGTFLFSFVKSF